MTEHIDPRPAWVRERTYELHQSGLSYDAARKQAEAEADDKFGSEENGENGDNGDNGNGNGATAS